MKRKQLKRLAALGLALTLGASGLTGCSGTDKKESAEKDGKIQLRYATGDAGPAVEVQEEIVKAFNESQDKIEVKLETYGTAFDQKLAACHWIQKGSGYREDVEFPGLL